MLPLPSSTRYMLGLSGTCSEAAIVGAPIAVMARPATTIRATVEARAIASRCDRGACDLFCALPLTAMMLTIDDCRSRALSENSKINYPLRRPVEDV